MQGFYGGKPGISFTIVERYKSVDEMKAGFALGGAYTAVGYGEYVIIDTDNKSSIENGILYQRGYAYNKEVTAPDIGTFEDRDAYDIAMKAYLESPGNGAIYIGKISGPMGKSPEIEILKESEIKEMISEEDPFKISSGTGVIDLVSGKDNHEITYSYCDYEDGNGNPIKVVLGFTIPYSVVEFESDKTDGYADGASLVELVENQPFYSKWKINVPQGIKGSEIEKIAIDPDNSQYYYQVRNFDESAEGIVEETKHYIGDYKVLDNVKFDEDNSSDLTFTYSTKEQDNIFVKALRSVDIVDADGGKKFAVTSTVDAKNADGSAQTEQTIVGDYLKSLQNISLQALENGEKRLLVTYSGVPASQSEDLIDYLLKTVNSVAIVTDTDGYSKFKVTYDGVSEGKETIISDAIVTIDNVVVEVDENGDSRLKVTYKGVSEGANTSSAFIGNPIKTINNISIKVDENNNRRFHVTYDGVADNEAFISADIVNFVEAIKIDTEYRLLILYSDLGVRQAIPESKQVIINNEIWENLGTVRGELEGLRIIGQLSSVDELPVGGPPQGYEGWIYTIQNEDESFEMYVYDYTTNTWFSIGSILELGMKPSSVMVVANDKNNQPDVVEDKVEEGGYWFVKDNGGQIRNIRQKLADNSYSEPIPIGASTSFIAARDETDSSKPSAAEIDLNTLIDGSIWFVKYMKEGD